jgi:hypothetical protein
MNSLKKKLSLNILIRKINSCFFNQIKRNGVKNSLSLRYNYSGDCFK